MVRSSTLPVVVLTGFVANVLLDLNIVNNFWTKTENNTVCLCVCLCVCVQRHSHLHTVQCFWGESGPPQSVLEHPSSTKQLQRAGGADAAAH